tara:strand:- start:198 stop:470 length:273 start_codon:yes stop_codon:yes gene_type:complete
MNGKKQQEQPKQTAAQRALKSDLDRRGALRALVALESATTKYLTDPGFPDGSLLRACLDARQIIQRAKAAIRPSYANRARLAELQSTPKR